jgi:cholesterol oxidase
VVIGSGFGGAVVAARLAEAGRSVCLLERGRRWSAPEYPRTFSQAAAGVWDEETNYGFLEYRVFGRLDVIQGCGVGGGSLSYYNVQLRAPAAIFERPEWPAVITRATLDRYYERAEDVMRPAPLVPPAGYPMPPRTEAFLSAAEAAGYEPFLVPIAVHTGETRPNPASGIVQEACRYTSDCLLGCRPRAKNSLDVTYLPMGERHGLVVRPLHLVDRIEPAGGDGDGYVLTARRFDPDRPGVYEPARVSAGSVVLAAGTLGTTELLFRARAVDRTLPALAASLGRRFSPNGDMVFAGTRDTDMIVDPSQGPSITAGAFVQPPGSPHVIQIQDLGYPPALTSLLDGTLPIPSRVRSLGAAAAGYVGAARRGASFPARNLFIGSFVPRFLAYLGLGTDAGDGRFDLGPNGRLRIHWDPAASEPMYQEMEAAMRKLSDHLGGHFVRGVLWRRPLRRLLTAHPLGGCAMGDSPSSGVVNDRGEVWGYPGLYVADGAAIPGPLAVNPSLTIASLAERVAQWMIHGREAD